MIRERQLRRRLIFHKEPAEIIIEKYKREEEDYFKKELENKKKEEEVLKEELLLKKEKEKEEFFKKLAEVKKKEEEIKKEKERINQIILEKKNEIIENKKNENIQKDFSKEIKYQEIIYPSYIKNKEVTVVIAHYSEDLSWTKNLQYPYIIISRKGLPREKAPNKGNEASSFLEYIIQNYDNLSTYTIFVHGHRTSWHHVSNIDERLNKNLILDKPYYNINQLKLNTHNIGNEEFIQILEKMYKISYNRHHKHKYRAGAQFYVHKDLILCNSKESYVTLYNYLMNSKQSSYYTGRYFEYSWHIIFTHSIDDID